MPRGPSESSCFFCMGGGWVAEAFLTVRTFRVRVTGKYCILAGKWFEGTYVVEGVLLVVLAKRRRCPRPAHPKRRNRRAFVPRFPR